jgi:D-alanyl-D-alanine carboxypeptidase
MTLLRRFVGVLALLLALAGCSGSADDDRPPADRSVQVNRTSASSLPTAAETFPAPSRSRLGGDLVRELQRILDDAVAGGDSPDLAAAAVISTKGRWVGIAGRDLEGGALTAQTTFAIASITKTFTAAEVLLLAERGQVDLDAPLSRYVDMPVTDLGATVRDALGMRSGIPDYLRTQVIDELALRRDRRVTVDDLLSRVRGAPSRPNVIFTYSNTNYLLLGQLIEEVTGMTYAAAIRRDLTSPLGLGGRIVAQDEQRPVPPLAPAAVRGRTRYLPNRALASGTWAAGGMASDAESVADWGYQLYGGRVLNPDSLQAMLPTSTGDYGLGTSSTRLTEHGLMVVGHQGDLPGASSVLAVQRDSEVSIAVLANRRGVRVDLLMDTIATALLTR